MGLIKNAQNMLALSGFQSHAWCWALRGILFQVAQGNFKLVALRDDHGALDNVLQFPYISRPGVAAERSHRCRRNSLNAFVHTPSVFLDKMAHEKWNILRALAQRGDGNRKHV